LDIGGGYGDNLISKIKKLANVEIKTSTKYAGLRKGRVRTLFVYCLRFR